MTLLAIFLDASFFLALFNQDDVHHNRAVIISEEIDANSYGQTLTSDDVFDEVVSVALRKFGKEKAQTFGEQIVGSVFILNGDRHIFDRAFKIFGSSRLPFSFTDCTSQAIIELAQVHHIATFDKQFEKLDIEVVK